MLFQKPIKSIINMGPAAKVFVCVHWTKKNRFIIFCKRLRNGFRGDQLSLISSQYDSFRCN